MPLTLINNARWRLPDLFIRSTKSLLDNLSDFGDIDGFQGLALRCFGDDWAEVNLPLLCVEDAWLPNVSGFSQSLQASLREGRLGPLIQCSFFHNNPLRERIMANWREKRIIEIVNYLGQGSPYVELHGKINANSVEELIHHSKMSGYQYVIDTRHILTEQLKDSKDFMPKNLQECFDFQKQIADHISHIMHVQPFGDMERFLSDWQLSDTGQAAYHALSIMRDNAKRGLYGDKPIIIILEHNPGLRGMLDGPFVRNRTRRLMNNCRDMVRLLEMEEE
jgi:hypothetical protein